MFKIFTELKTRESWSEQNYARNFDLSWSHVRDEIERIHVKDVSPKEFIDKFEAPYKPVVILGAQDEWKALEKWTKEVKTYRIQLEILGKLLSVRLGPFWLQF